MRSVALKGNMSEEYSCEECAAKCLLIHRKNLDPSSIVSSFFKVVIDDRFLRFLPVPPRFAPRLASLVDQETRVEDSSGRKWIVTLSKVNGCLAFKKGWDAFSLEHGIKLGDFLVFHYIIDSHFVVQIYGRSGCEKLTLHSEKNPIQNKRNRTTADGSCDRSGEDSELSLATNPSNKRIRTRVVGPCNRSDEDSELCLEIIPSNKRIRTRVDSPGNISNKDPDLCLATVPSNDEKFEEPCLMMVNRDTRVAGEEERIPLFDLFAPEIVSIKPVGKLDDVGKGNGSSNVEDLTDNHNAVQDLMKDPIDANNATREGNKDLEMSIMQIEDATGLEGPEQLHNRCLSDNDDLLEDALNVKMCEINEQWKNKVQWTSEIDHKSKIATKGENDTWIFSSELRYVEQPTSAVGGRRDMNIVSHQKASCRRGLVPVSASNGQTKVVKTEHKVFIKEEVGSGPVFNINAHDNLKAVANAGEVRQIVKTEPVDHTLLQVTCTVTRNSVSYLEIPKGLPTGRAEVEEMVVILRDSVGRRWPVLYLERNGLNALVNGWKSFSRANGIRFGNLCVITLEDQSESVYGVRVIQ